MSQPTPPDPKATFKEWFNEAMDERAAAAKTKAEADAKAAEDAKPKGLFDGLFKV